MDTTSPDRCGRYCRLATPRPRKVSTTNTFYAIAAIDMMRAAVNSASSARRLAEHHLAEDTLRALYSLR